MLSTSASAPEFDQLLTQFRMLGLSQDSLSNTYSRVFCAPRPQIAPEGDSVESRLLKILDTFTKQFNQELNQVFQFVHQRLAPMNTIDDEHAKLRLQVKELNKKMKAAWEDAICLYDHIPFISNPQSQVEALYCMVNIEFLSEYCLLRGKDLGNLLGDTSRDVALKYFKKTIKECEVIGSILTIEEKVTQLDTLVHRTMKECDSRAITQYVYEVYDAMYLFMQYTVRSLRREVPETKINLQAQLNSIESRLRGKLGNFCVDLDYREYRAREQSAENVFVENSKHIVLPTENTFRNAPWKRYITLIPYVGRYSNISTQIANLEGIAKAIYSKEISFMDSYKRDSNGVLDPLSLARALEEGSKICAGLQRLIESEIRSLAQLPIANEIHAGWNYAASLLVQVKVLNVSIERFRNNRFLKDMVCAVNVLKVCILEPKTADVGTQFTQCMDIWHAASSIQQFSPMKAIDSSLGQIAFRVLKLTEAEKMVPKLVCSETYDWSDITSKSWAITYFIKGFLRYVYFPFTNLRSIDKEFENTLTIVKLNPKYKQTFQAWLNTSEITTLYHAYLTHAKAV